MVESNRANNANPFGGEESRMQTPFYGDVPGEKSIDKDIIIKPRNNFSNNILRKIVPHAHVKKQKQSLSQNLQKMRSGNIGSKKSGTLFEVAQAEDSGVKDLSGTGYNPKNMRFASMNLEVNRHRAGSQDKSSFFGPIIPEAENSSSDEEKSESSASCSSDSSDLAKSEKSSDENDDSSEDNSDDEEKLFQEIMN